MAKYTMEQLKSALMSAHNAGDSQSAAKIAAVIRRNKDDVGLQINPEGQVPEIGRKPEATLGENVVGAGEAALTAVTGATGGVIGGVGGTLKGIAQEILSGKFGTQQASDAVDQAALAQQQGAAALTYAPRTEAGKQMVGALGSVAQQLPALIPAMGAAGAAASGVKPAMQMAAVPARVAAAATAAGAKTAANKIKESIPGRSKAQATAQQAPQPVRAEYDDVALNDLPDPESTAGLSTAAPSISAPAAISPQAKRLRDEYRPLGEDIEPQSRPTRGTAPSAGSAGVNMGTLRQQRANELPGNLPPLLKSMRTRDPKDVQFERETMRDAELGEPLRDRVVELNAGLLRAAESLFDAPKRGSDAGERIAKSSDNLRGIGVAIDKVLQNKAAIHKKREQVEYEKADKAGELRMPAQIPSAITFLNESRAYERVAPSLGVARAEALRLGVARELEDGTLVPVAAPLKTIEIFRKGINSAVDDMSKPDLRYASELKRKTDADTENAGGDIYKKAREISRAYYEDFHDTMLVRQLLGKKRGTTDRAVAYEAFLDKAILNPATSLDSAKKLRHLLVTSGSEGMKAWFEIKGGVLQHIITQATKGINTNSAGDKKVNPAQLERVITELDRNGKLEFVFGAKKADMLRALRDVAKDVHTIPENIVNSSGTGATVKAMLMDVPLMMMGAPGPVMLATNTLVKKAKKLRDEARVKEALAPPPNP